MIQVHGVAKVHGWATESMSLVFRHRFPLQHVGANQSGIIACLLRGKIFF